MHRITIREGHCLPAIFVTLVAFALVTFLPMPALATEGLSQPKNHLNVDLVIDGSGSLTYGNDATDPKGLRYDAIDLFLSLLTNDGNNVGAIVFNDNSDTYLLHTGIQPVSGKSQKLALAQQIRSAGADGDTDIGSALLTAVQELGPASSENGLPSVVVLFSDGRTDLGTDDEALQRSLANKEQAIVEAQSAGIPVYTICLNASSVADPDELSAISSRTSGQAVAVASPEDLSGAFESFYNVIFSTSSANTTDVTFGENGTATQEIQVPAYGAEEVNVIVSDNDVNDITASSPSGALSPDALAANTMTGGHYEVMKLVDPEAGTWSVTLTGTPGATARVNAVYNVNTSAALSVPDDAESFGAGDSVDFTARLYKDGEPITDSSIVKEYSSILTVTNQATGESQSFSMEPGDDGAFTYSFAEPTADPASFVASAVLSAGEISQETNQIQLSFANTPPSVVDSNDVKDGVVERKVLVTPFSGHTDKVDVSSYFSDEQDGGNGLEYSLTSTQLEKNTAVLDGSTLTVDTAHSRSGDVVIEARDSQGSATSLTVHYSVTNLTIPIYVIILALLALLAVVIMSVHYARTHRVFVGKVTISDLNNRNKVQQVSLRGRKTLQGLGASFPGMDAMRCYLIAQDRRTLLFTSKQGFFSDRNKESSKKLVLRNGRNCLYSDAAHSQGICIEVEPGMAARSFGSGRSARRR